MLPPELQQPTPRDPQKAQGMLTKNKSLVRNLFIGALCMPFLLPGLCWLKFGSDAVGYGFYCGLGLCVLVALMGYAMKVNMERSLRLYTDGIATLGTIKKIHAPGDRHGNAYVTIHLDFKDHTGQSLSGQLVTLGNTKDVDRKEGDEIAVLFLKENPKKFAVFTPGIGMASGVVR